MLIPSRRPAHFPRHYPSHHASDGKRREWRILDIEITSAVARLQQFGEALVELLAQTHQQSCLLALQVFFFALVNHNVFLVLNDDGRHPLNDEPQFLARAKLRGPRFLQCLQRTRDAHFADGVQDFALIAEV